MITHSKTLSSGLSVLFRTDVGDNNDCSVLYCEAADKPTKADKAEAEEIVGKLLENHKYKGETELKWEKWSK